ncbi:mitochondrial thiamine pyrophosphate carrier-like isoform X2 [Cydia pomonella]|uniref:mitochondrial thiamine pyrophosphate carrier-like isoform X2 n=1 Tax=Cydia pomonella TaxID=82600 RepID=UPI002ADE4AFB|nr:mitochondrial thiamine pyrophosphate carrier-like isoform X2 [Cydia pomonella]XP_061706587.1 mitochondrial thiamine pyrophosphate carrier-like isoform X2 [Cydia pomonella]
MVVGYKKDETLTPNQKLIAGVVSGITTRFITQPLDIVKVRTQLQAKDKGSTWIGLSWRIFKEEGVTTFWHGHSLGQLHSILSVASQFHAYEISTKFVENYASQYTSPQFKKVLLFMCGIFAGCVSATLVSPIEVIRVRQMVVKAQYGGMLQGAREVYRRGGILAFYEGLTASLMQMGPQVGITFAVFRFVQPLVLDYLVYLEDGEQTDTEKKATKTKHLLISSSIAGSTAGFVSKTATYPFDLAKRRLQIGSHQPDPNVKTPTMSQNLVKCSSLVSCLLDMVRKEGVSGLYAGWDVSNYRAQVQSVAAFTTYEMVCYAQREYYNRAN